MSEFPAYLAYGHEHTRVEEYIPSQVAGETMIVGDLCVWDGPNNWVQRAAADPTAILGLLETDSERHRVLTPNGAIPVRRILPGAVLALSCGTLLSGTTHRNNEYGITRSTAGRWQLDPAKTAGSARVKVVRIGNEGNLANQIAFVEVLQEFLDDTIDS